MRCIAYCLSLVISVAVTFTTAAHAERPNLIVIMVDDMGYAGVSCFGNPYFKTPEIDRLAAEGMRLTDFHSSGTVCSPTRAGLLTGRYQQRAGIEAVIHPVADHPEHRKGLQLAETHVCRSPAASRLCNRFDRQMASGLPPELRRLSPAESWFRLNSSATTAATSILSAMSAITTNTTGGTAARRRTNKATRLI